MAARTVYDHIAANNRKTWLLVALFPISLFLLFVLGIGAVVYGTQDSYLIKTGIEYYKHVYTVIGVTPASPYIAATLGLSLAAFVPVVVLALAWMLISYFFGDRMMLGFAGAHELSDVDPKYKYIYKAVENVAIAAGLPTPKVYIIDDSSLNAFATGRDPEKASVALTVGIIEKLDRLELEGVIAHEMAHIGNHDIRLDMMIITGLGIFGFLAELLSHSWRFRTSSSNDNKNSGAIYLLIFALWLVFIIFNAIVAPLINFAISRTREYAADATGALITRNPAALASALVKISADPRVEALDTSRKMAVACIENPLEPKALNAFSTHPPMKDRVERLRKMV